MAHDPSSETEPGAGTGWEDQPDSPELIASLAERIGEQQRKVAASSHSALNDRVDRGRHQKQLFGAFGTLRIRDEIPDAPNHGPFVKNAISASPLEHRVACRFSNGQPCPFSDNAADVQ
jgi:catalase